MEPARTGSRRAAPVTTATEVLAYPHVADQLARLVAKLGLDTFLDVAMRVFDEIGARSLAFPLGSPPSQSSGINEDGTPIQLATAVGPSQSGLHFIGEPGWTGSSETARHAAAERCIAAAAAILDAEGALVEVAPAIAIATSTGADEWKTHRDGAYWIGVSFVSNQPPQLRLYVNGRWGSNPDRWSRMRGFAGWFGEADLWGFVEETSLGYLEPLGVSVNLSGRRVDGGRIYLTGYGNRIEFYLRLATAAGGAPLADIVAGYASQVLADEIGYPTRTVVWSVGLGGAGEPDHKFEMCSHCLFPSDAVASTRLTTVFETSQLDPAPYTEMLRTVSEGRLSRSSVDVHCFAGVGTRSGVPYFPVYMKPILVRRR